MLDVSKLVERQLTLCELKRRLEEEGRRPAAVRVEEVAYGPCLLVSRECGSGGGLVARLVGQRLRWHVFNREIVEQIAQRAEVRRQLIESVDERVRSRWLHILRSAREREDFGFATYLHYLHEIVLTLGHQGDVVIVGRGAQYVLPPQCAVRVRIVAPIALRVQRVAESQKLPLEEAKSFVRRCDTGRATFIQKTFQRDTHSPLNYDVVLNTGDLSIEAATDTVLAALRGKLAVPADNILCAR